MRCADRLTRTHLEEYVSEKVTNWVSEVAKLAEFALSQPQACYAAYTFGLKHRWEYFLRTLPCIQDLLESLLISAIMEHKLNFMEHKLNYMCSWPLDKL